MENLQNLSPDNPRQMLKDQFGRVHDYLRISLTDKCNLRCFYCMPETPCFMKTNELMSDEEVLEFSNIFVNELGIKKIRLTGGEPLARKNIDELLINLSKLPMKLAITTNATLIDQHFDTFEKIGLKSLNISLDSLNEEKFNAITKRALFKKVKANIEECLRRGFNLKINVVAIKDVNEEEFLDFVRWTKRYPVHVRFIEFMPFNGNQWDIDKVVSFLDIMKLIKSNFKIEKLKDHRNAVAKGFRVKGHRGTFSVISSVTVPFCSGCSRIRLTSDGKIRNCLFSRDEWDILSAYRKGEDIRPIIQEAVWNKASERGGLPEFAEQTRLMESLSERSMVKIGG